MTRTWAPIPGFPKYEVDAFGRVRSLRHRRPRLLTPFVSHGYLRVTLVTEDKKRHKRAVHTLVALAHVDPWPPDGYEVAHLDGDRQNCRADNLRWVTHEENCAHKSGHGTLLAGDAHSSTRLTSELRAEAFARLDRGEPLADVARAFDVSPRQLRRLYQRHEDERLGLPF